MNSVRLSLIGVGGYGEKLTRCIEAVPNLKIVTCYHPDNERTRAAAQKIGCRIADTDSDAICADDIDGVVISTPDHVHFPYLQKAIRANKHVFVEKPMVSCWDDAVILNRMLRNYPPVFFVGHNMRREAGIRFLKEEYDSGRLGELVTFRIDLSHGGAFHWEDRYWRTRIDECREGPLRVNGVHASDVLEYLFGPIVSVFARVNDRHTRHSAPTTGIALTGIGHTFGIINTSWVVPSLNLFHFQFTDAIVDFDLSRLQIRYGRDVACVPSESKTIPLDSSDSRILQFEEFAAAILNGQQVETGFSEGFRAVLFFEACRRSFLNKTAIELSEIMS